MAAINWVCASCAQHFSRRYTANRHDRNLHEGKGIIVSILDYVVGRISGQFQSKNPLESRRDKQNGLLFGSKTANNNFGPKVIADSTSGVVSQANDKNIQERASHNPNLVSQPTRNSDNNVTSTADPFQEIAQRELKLQEFSGLVNKYYHKQDADDIFAFCKYLVSQGNNDFLEKQLNFLRNIDNSASNSGNSPDKSVANKQNPGMPHSHVSDFSFVQPWPYKKHDQQESGDVYNQAKAKLSEIEQVLSLHYPREKVQNIIEELVKTCNSTGKYDILDEALKRHRSNVRRLNM
jgi:hypothetical protein